ncbi:hypothetical protein QFC21_004355 [Naganishia friedmannii]|uniref:Uncharacterized protein n=1 Tax=Naganishia friedmannii TaxID=89922 RepID=A0ACC2VHE6_9TREE|nr:hypothetical protein QFC21_004355 [Naganishia friedmannii]
MGFSLFKKKNKDKTAPASPSVPAANNQRLSVPTNTMKGAYSPSVAGSPRPAGSPRVPGTPSYLNSPALSVNEWGQTPSMTNARKIKLRCVLDPLPNTAGNMQQDVNSRGEALKELFYISAELDAPIDTLRRDITRELGVQGKFSVGVYKVCIPWAAHYQSRTYSHRYALPAHLLAHFPSYNLDDPQQLNSSYSIQPITQHLVRSGDEGRSAPSETTVEDWWPEGIDNKDGVISLLIRLKESEEEDVSPLTLMVHFANQDVKPVLSLPLAPAINHMGAFVVEDDAPCPPLALEMSRDATVSELKEAILKADGRPVGLLEKIKLWKVDMTWKEIVECELSGDGQNGSMPWPYSPQAPDTTPLQDMNVSLDEVFPAYKPNTNVISVFVWIHPSALGILTRSKDLTTSILGESIPNFQYPMKIRRHASKLERQAMLEKNKIRTITAQMENASGTYGRRPSLARHGRPNTAPSSAASSPGSSPTLSPMSFNGRKGILKRSSSGLPNGYTSPFSSNMPFAHFSMTTTMYRSPGGSVSSSNVTSPISSDSEDSAFSSVPHTPLGSVMDLRITGDLISSILPGPAKTVRWSETTDVARKKSQVARAVTIAEGNEGERDGIEDLTERVNYGLVC